MVEICLKITIIDNFPLKHPKLQYKLLLKDPSQIYRKVILREIHQILGSRFFFSLELERQESQKRCELPLPVELQHKKVLLIDDNRTAVNITRTILESFQLDVDGALSGPIALKLIKQQQRLNKPLYEIIVLDWLMPDMDGISTAEYIFSLYPQGELPYLLVQTVSPEDPEIINFVKQQANCFLLPKPIKRSSLRYNILRAYGLEGNALEEDVNDEKQQSYLEYNYDYYREQLAGLRILLAEDNELNQEVAIDVLESIGIEVIVAENGQLAIDILRQRQLSEQPIDMLLMDLQMPIMDGLSASRLLRADEAYHDLPIIALTAHAQDKNREECFDAGMNDFLSKPFDAPDLYKKLLKQLIISRHIQVLMVEDNLINQEIISAMMDELGLLYDIVETGDEAIKLFSTKNYQLVFMDLQLPDMDGFAATRRLRQIEQESSEHKQVPVIAITASTLEEDKEQARQNGMNDYLVKPFELEQLQQLLLQWTDKKESVLSLKAAQEQEQEKGLIAEDEPLLTLIDDSDTIAVLDKQAITQLLNRPQLFIHLRDLYIGNYQQELDKLEQAIKQSNMVQIAAIAHPFKSSSKQMGAMALGEMLFSFEKQGRAGQLADNADEQIQQIHEEFQRVVTALEQIESCT